MNLLLFVLLQVSLLLVLFNTIDNNKEKEE
jgi:hypothetical protein